MRKEKLLATGVFMLALLSFLLPVMGVYLQEQSLMNQVSHTQGKDGRLNGAQPDTLPMIISITTLGEILTHGDKTHAEVIPTNEKSPLVLVELMQAEIVTLQQLDIIPTGNYTVKTSPLPYYYTHEADKTLVWEYMLVDEKGNEMILLYHSGVGKIIRLDWQGVINDEPMELDDTPNKNSHWHDISLYLMGDEPNMLTMGQSASVMMPNVMYDITLGLTYKDRGFVYQINPVYKKVNLGEYIQIPPHILAYFKKHPDLFKLNEEHDHGATWFMNENPDNPPHPPKVYTQKDYEALTEQQITDKKQRLVEYNIYLKEWANWSSIGAIIDVTEEPQKLVYIHLADEQLYQEIRFENSILDHVWFGSVITITHTATGEIDEVKLIEIQDATYWEFIDGIRE